MINVFKYALLGLVGFFMCISVTSCDDKEEIDHDPIIGCHFPVCSYVIESSDGNAKVVYPGEGNGNLIVAPKEGGIFEFTLSKNAKVFYKGVYYDLTSFDFTLLEALEMVFNDTPDLDRFINSTDADNYIAPPVPQQNMNLSLDKEFDCQFGHISTKENGFILTVDPNPGLPRAYTLMFTSEDYTLKLLAEGAGISLWQY